MKLTTLFTGALALIFAALLVLPDDADAKRFGAGRSLGRQYESMQRQAQPPRQTAAPSRAQTQGAPGAQTRPQSNMGRWLGPLAGLAAGGLLASLFFGDGFEGISFMDVIVIVVLGLGVFWLLRMFRGGRAAAPVPAGATPGPAPVASMPEELAPAAPQVQQRESEPAASQRTTGFTPPGMGSTPPRPQGNDQFPFWFDGIAFINGAKQHFIGLQAAWDRADFDAIESYTTRELFEALGRERGQLDDTQSAEVVQLKAELVTLQREKDQAVASIRFHGLIREEERGVAEPFSETWHIVHAWDSPDGDWLISGIQQGD